MNEGCYIFSLQTNIYKLQRSHCKPVIYYRSRWKGISTFSMNRQKICEFGNGVLMKMYLIVCTKFEIYLINKIFHLIIINLRVSLTHSSERHKYCHFFIYLMLSFMLKLKKNLRFSVKFWKKNPFHPDCKTIFSRIYYTFFFIFQFLSPKHDCHVKFIYCSA